MVNKIFDDLTELDKFIYLTITEEATRHYKTRGFSTVGSWCNYTKKHLTSSVDIVTISYELSHFYTILFNRYSLSDSEATKYLLKFFINDIWTYFLPYIEAKSKYFKSKYYTI